jgi:hypothetical protein
LTLRRLGIVSSSLPQLVPLERESVSVGLQGSKR